MSTCFAVQLGTRGENRKVPKVFQKCILLLQYGGNSTQTAKNTIRSLQKGTEKGLGYLGDVLKDSHCVFLHKDELGLLES